MLFIDPNTKKISELSEIHFNAVKCVVRKRIGSKINCGCKICNGGLNARSGVKEKLTQILEDEGNLRQLILAKPNNLKTANNKVFKLIFKETTLTHLDELFKKRKQFLENNNKEDAKKKHHEDITPDDAEKLKTFTLLSKIFDYNEWFNKLDAHAEYGPYLLAEKLGMRSCTYCNRQYTLTVQSQSNKSGKLTRPQFDHWISKDRYPLLGLSFFNLLPSCPTCNSSVKGNTKFNTKEFMHPYQDNVINDIQFSFEYWATANEYKIHVDSTHSNLKEKDRINNTLKTFKIEEVYNGHHPELDDLIQLSKAYSPEYLNILKKSFHGANLTDEQIYRYAFGTELNSNDFHKRPLSKFKYDILKQLGIIID